MRTILYLVLLSFLTAHAIVGGYMVRCWLDTVYVRGDPCMQQLDDALRAMRFHSASFTVCDGETWKVEIKRRWINSILVYKRLKWEGVRS